MALAFFVLFVVSLVVGALVNFILGRLVAKTFLRGTDRLLGIGFGLTRGVLLLALGVLVARLTHIPEMPSWEESQLIPYVEPVAGLINDALPESMQHAEVEPVELPSHPRESGGPGSTSS